MIIEETENMRRAEVSIRDGKAAGDLINIQRGTNYMLFDKQQAAQLIEVLQKWIDGGEVE